MKQLVSVNLTTRTASNWTPPEITFKEDLTLALRFTKNSEGEEIEAKLTINSVKASVGLVDARPDGGRFCIKIGNAPASESNTTDLLDGKISASQLAAKLNAVDAHTPYGTARATFEDGSWMIAFGAQAQQVPLEIVNNELWPLSLGIIAPWRRDGKWIHELRLTQAPVALTNSFDIQLPPAPEIKQLQAGGTSGGFEWNEIQELYIPAEFRGAFVIKRGFAKTTKLSGQDTIDTIQTALQALGKDCFKVELPLSQRPTIEFVGDYRGQPQDLLVPQVVQAPVGDLTFTIKFDREELATILRRQSTVTLPLEIRINGTDDSGITGELVAFTLDVTMKRPVSSPMVEENPTLDLLRPYSARTYVPFGANNEWIGEKVYPKTVGDGAAETFVIATGLNSEVVFVWGRENMAGGRQLIQGTHFDVAIDNDNQVTVTSLVGAPALNEWVFIVFSAQTVRQWAADLTVTVSQVIAGDGFPALPDFMENVFERLQTLEELVIPGVAPAVADSSTVGLVSVIPEISEVLFYDKKMTVGEVQDMKALFTEKGLDVEKFIARKAPVMLPAVHDGTLTDPLPTPLPAATAGTVWVADGRTLIPGGGGIRSAYVENDGFVASDGRLLYPAIRAGETTSYHPQAFERIPFVFSINDEMLAVKRTLEVLFGIQVQLVHANCAAQWILSMQIGAFTSDTTPAPTGLNLANIQWGAPVFERVINLSRLAQSHFFGLRIQRTVSGFILDQQKYGNWTPNNAAAPASPNFAVRAMLDRFDTENKIDPRAYVAWKLIGSINIDDQGKQTTKPAQLRIY